MQTNTDKKEKFQERIYGFALAVVRLVRRLPRETASAAMARQLIRAGTSVAANYEEAIAAFSKADFAYKISICLRESKEARIWLRLIKDSGIYQSEDVEKLVRESFEIASIFAKSLKTLRKDL